MPSDYELSKRLLAPKSRPDAWLQPTVELWTTGGEDRVEFVSDFVSFSETASKLEILIGLSLTFSRSVWVSMQVSIQVMFEFVNFYS